MAKRRGIGTIGNRRTEIIYGIHPVVEALRANRRAFQSVHLAAGRRGRSSGWVSRIAKLAEPRHIPLVNMTADQIAAMSGTDEHQGIAAKVSAYPLTGIETVIPDPCPQDLFLVMLDHVVDPHNFGAILRTAHCAGVSGVFVSKDRSAPPSATVSKISAGALEHMDIVRVTNMVRTMETLKSKGVWVAGLDRGARDSVFSLDFPAPIALVIGGEQKGIRPLVKKHCDMLCAIPQAGSIDSLNASVAGAIVMYEVYRQRSSRQ